MKRKGGMAILIIIFLIFIVSCQPARLQASHSLPTSTIPADIPLPQPETMIVQYYTFLGQGLYEEAYHLLSAARPHPKSFEDYELGARNSFRKVEIYSVIPYNRWAADNGYSPVEDRSSEKYFYVEIAAWGEGNMAGSVPNGLLQVLFIKTVQEGDQWRIFTIATNPPLR